jgi:cell division protein FtsZ
MPILSWGWWRRITRDAIAVTIIATGFDIEQQIVNTQDKKNHTHLEDEQRSVHNLSSKTVAAFDLNEYSFKFKRKNSFDLLEDTVVAPEPVVTSPTINKEELIVMSEFIKI